MRLRLVAILFTGLALSAAPASGAGVALDNLGFSLAGTAYRIPHASVEGATLSAAELAKLLAGAAPALDRLAATRIVIPELVGESDANGLVQRALYRDVTLENIANGRIGALRIGASEQSAERGGVRVEARYGPVEIAGLDLKQLAHVATASRAVPDEALQPVGESFSVTRARFFVPAARFSLDIGQIAGTGVKARALAGSWPQLLERLSQDGGASASQEGAALLAGLADATASIEVGALTASDLAAHGFAGDKPYSFAAGRLELSRLAGAVAGATQADNLTLASADGGVVTLRRLTLAGVDARPLFAEGGRRLPAVGRFALEGFAADLPDAEGGAGRVKVSLAAAAADLSDYIQGAPTRGAVQADHFVIGLAERGETPATALFLSLGYRSLDISGAGAWSFREKEQQATLERLRFEIADMGVIAAAASFDNVSAAVFSTSELIAKAAAARAALKRLDLTLEGGGLVARMVQKEAKARGADPDRVREDYARDAGRLAAALLGDRDKAKAIGDAVSAWLRRPERLQLTLVSKKGIGALDLMLRAPGDILAESDVAIAAVPLNPPPAGQKPGTLSRGAEKR